MLIRICREIFLQIILELADDQALEVCHSDSRQCPAFLRKWLLVARLSDFIFILSLFICYWDQAALLYVLNIV